MSRTRSRSETTVYEDLSIDYTIGPGTDGIVQTFESSSGNETITDVVTPNYAKRIARGDIINNPCLYESTKDYLSGSGFGSFSNIAGTSAYTLSGPLSSYRWQNDSAQAPGDLADLIGPVDYTEDRCKLNAIAYLDSTPYEFGEDVGEILETVRFLKNPLASLFKLSRSFKASYIRKLRRKRAATHREVKLLQRNLTRTERLLYEKSRERWLHSMGYDLKKLDLRIALAHADVYLSYRFALSPLIRSCQDALEAYSKVHVYPPRRRSARGIQMVSKSESDTFQAGVRHWGRDVTVKRDGKASILYEVSNPVHDWKYKLGLRAKDVPTVMWQLVPYSFMVDRLFDITSFSKGVINLADPRVRILAASYREKYDWKSNIQLLSQDGTATWNTPTIVGEKIVNEYFSYDRSVWSPSVADTVPNFTPGNLINDTLKVLDLAALIGKNLNPVINL